ncbi:MAG: carboxypeptidase-like regulatory domain-containing protein [Dehalococcoidia bacterium]
MKLRTVARLGWYLILVMILAVPMVLGAMAPQTALADGGSGEESSLMVIATPSGAYAVEMPTVARTENAFLSAEPTGSISGHVYKADGITPIPHVGIVAWTWDNPGPAPAIFTDATGYYIITGLASGQYRVMAIGGFAPGYANELFNNSYDWNAATPVAVAAPSDTSGTNFNLDIAGSLSGNIYMADGVTPITNFIRILTPDLNPASGYPMILVVGQGSYRLTGLPTGSYRVQACASCTGLSYQDEWYNNVLEMNAATPVSVVAPGDTPGINFSLTTTTGPVLVTQALASIAGKYSTVWTFNAATQHWLLYNPGNPAYANNLAAMVRGQAYYILATENCTLTYGTLSYQLYQGWNLIGWLG